MDGRIWMILPRVDVSIVYGLPKLGSLAHCWATGGLSSPHIPGLYDSQAFFYWLFIG